MRQFQRDTAIHYSLAVDETAVMNRSVGVRGLPHVLLIDSTGIVPWQGYPLASNDRLTEEVVGQVIAMDKAQRKAR